jgi:carbonic anhydrase
MSRDCYLILFSIFLSMWNLKYVSANDDWDYSKLGPDVWSERWSTCGGQRQSPINIMTKCTDQRKFDPLNFTSVHDKQILFRMENNGHTIKVHTDTTGLLVNGGNLNGRFYFDSFHLHWGPNHKSGSEHQM